MAVLSIKNSYAGWLILWLEPLGEDRWLRPGERFHIRSDYTGDDPDFEVNVWAEDAAWATGIQNITIWITHGNPSAKVTDEAGNVVECGHQRPTEIHEKWQAMHAEAYERMQRRRTPARPDDARP